MCFINISSLNLHLAWTILIIYLQARDLFSTLENMKTLSLHLLDIASSINRNAFTLTANVVHSRSPSNRRLRAQVLQIQHLLHHEIFQRVEDVLLIAAASWTGYRGWYVSLLAVLAFTVVFANRTALRVTMTPENQVRLAHVVLALLVLEVGLFLRIILLIVWELGILTSASAERWSKWGWGV